MARLVLIRHSKVIPNRVVPPKQWQLSDEGRRLCRPLAMALRPEKLDLLVSSKEPKAVETAELLASRLRIETQTISMNTAGPI